LVEGWAVGGMVDGAVDKISKHVICKLIATFPSNSSLLRSQKTAAKETTLTQEEKKKSVILPLVGRRVDGAVGQNCKTCYLETIIVTSYVSLELKKKRKKYKLFYPLLKAGLMVAWLMVLLAKL